MKLPAFRALLLAAVLAIPESAPAIELHLQSVKSSYRSGESPVVRVLAVNPVTSPAAQYLKRNFRLVPFSSPMDGDLALFIEVKGPDGVVLERTKAMVILVRMQTTPLMFQRLRVGEVFGEEIALDGPGLEYKMTKPGTYSVIASLSSSSPREWFDRWSSSNPGAKPEFGRDELFEGPVFAGPLKVVVTDATPSPLTKDRHR